MFQWEFSNQPRDAATAIDAQLVVLGMIELVIAIVSSAMSCYSVSSTRQVNTSVNSVNTGSDNGLSPGRRQAIIWTNAKIFLIESLGTNFK